MTYDDSFTDAFEHYEDLFDPAHADRKARRARKPKNKHIPKVAQAEIIEEIADAAGLESGFHPTYRPSRHEEGWLLSSLESFYDQHIITDILAQVRGGKEANVYCCSAHPSTGLDLIAAKVYRPRQFRQLRNDKLYREGRAILTADGRPVKKTDDRLLRAVGKKTAFGVQVSHTSWLMYEYTTLRTLHEAGAAVPRPVAAGENAILMGYVGDAQMAAPMLSEIGLEPKEAAPLLDEVLRNIELMLQHGMIHGDLSAYNLLYWQGAITLIDFPQVTDSRANPNARAIFQRDVRRICEYFARQGVERDADALARWLWKRYAQPRPDDLAADLSRDFDDPAWG